MINTLKTYVGRSVVFCLNPKTSKEFLDATMDASFLGTILEVDETGVVARGFLSSELYNQYLRDKQNGKDEKDSLWENTSVVALPWTSIIGIDLSN